MSQDTVVIPYRFSVACPNSPISARKFTKTHFDYIQAENFAEEKFFVFGTLFKSDHFSSVVFMNVSTLNKSIWKFRDEARQIT